MYKKTVIWALVTIVLALLSLILVFSFADKPNSANNGFKRDVMSTGVKLMQTYNVGFPVKRFLGATDEKFYFTSVNPRTIFSLDYKHGKIDSIYAPFPLNETVLNNYRMSGVPPFFLIFAGNLSSIISYRIGDTSAQIKKLSPPLFTSGVMISSGNYILKSFDSTKTNQIFEKIDSSNGISIVQNDLFSKQTDGGFSLDGALRYSSSSQLLIYLQYYQNRMYCLDTALNVKYVKNTIDTTYTNTVSTEALAIEDNKASLAPKVPLKPIYSDFIVSGKNIFILSRLKADNEDPIGFQRNSVIDVYDIIDGSYRFSFYIPNVSDVKARYLYIHNNNLMTSYGSVIATFDLTEILVDHSN